MAGARCPVARLRERLSLGDGELRRCLLPLETPRLGNGEVHVHAEETLAVRIGPHELDAVGPLHRRSDKPQRLRRTSWGSAEGGRETELASVFDSAAYRWRDPRKRGRIRHRHLSRQKRRRSLLGRAAVVVGPFLTVLVTDRNDPRMLQQLAFRDSAGMMALKQQPRRWSDCSFPVLVAPGNHKTSASTGACGRTGPGATGQVSVEHKST